MDDPNNTEFKRNTDGTFAQGTAPGPGRPKGKTMKEYARDFFMQKTDEEKKAYIEWLDQRKPGFAWEMGEGKARQDVDMTSNGESLQPILVKFINGTEGDSDTNRV